MKGCKLYDSRSGKVHVSGDIVIQENLFWSWDQDDDTHVTMSGHVISIEGESDGGINTVDNDELSTPVRSYGKILLKIM